MVKTRTGEKALKLHVKVLQLTASGPKMGKKITISGDWTDPSYFVFAVTRMRRLIIHVCS